MTMIVDSAPHVTAHPTAEAMLEARTLTKSYGDVPVLESVDLIVRPGEFLTLLGPSGSGKTTLLKLIAGFEHPTAGHLLLDGRDITSLAPSQRGIGMVFQNYALFPHMTVAENIAYGLRLRRWKKDRCAERVDQMLEMIGLRHVASRKPSELSGGQQQRVALARALAYSPKLLLMDEPLGALDRWLRLQMEDELRKVHRTLGTTIVYVTHDQEEALVLSDRVAIVNEGRIAALGTPDSLYRNPPNPFAARFFSSSNVISIRAEPTGDRTALDSGAGRVFVDRAMGRSGTAEVAIRPRSLTLEGPERGEGLRFRGIVEDVCLLGDDCRVDIRTSEHGIVRALDSSPTAYRVRPGDEVTAFALASDVIVF